MIDERRQAWGIAGLLLPAPALSIYVIFFLSRFFYGAMIPAAGIIPDSKALQLLLFAGLPIIGLLSSMWAYGAARDPMSKTGLILNTLVLLTTLAFILIEYHILLL